MRWPQLDNAAAVSVLSLLFLLFAWWIHVVASRSRRFSLDERVVVITGGASGIGRALAETIARNAQRVTLVLVDVDAAGLEGVKSGLEQIFGKNGSIVRTFRCDVSDCSAVETCMQAIAADIAPKDISVLVNNAGIVTGRSLHDLTPEQVRRTFEVNTFAHFWTTKAVLPTFKDKRDGLLVTISSVMGLISACSLSDYCASKSAACNFHDSVRLELMRDGYYQDIRTLLVCPHEISSGMFAGIMQGKDWSSWLSRLLLPSSTPQECAQRIYTAITHGETLVVSCYTGWRGWVVPWVPAASKLFPSWIYDWIVYAGGGARGMDTFVGRTKQKTM